jgi:NAD(P)-dependent dehydrogenase (short-subunit alcohol dehydrogenase family)
MKREHSDTDTITRNNSSTRDRQTRNPLAGLRVAVTGGTSGLGLALVRQLLAQGAHVALVARHRQGIDRVLRQHPEAHGIAGDVSRKDDIYPIAMQILGDLGGLDVLINNASSLGPTPLALLGDTACEDLEQALATNLVGPFRLTKALLGALTAAARERGAAVVINISSDAALNPYPRWGAYGASKAALHHLSRIWHEELAAEGVRLLSLDPGDMDTPLHALAVPDTDPATLKAPAAAAQEVIAALSAALPQAPPRARSAPGVVRATADQTPDRTAEARSAPAETQRRARCAPGVLGAAADQRAARPAAARPALAKPRRRTRPAPGVVRATANQTPDRTAEARSAPAETRRRAESAPGVLGTTADQRADRTAAARPVPAKAPR